MTEGDVAKILLGALIGLVSGLASSALLEQQRECRRILQHDRELAADVAGEVTKWLPGRTFEPTATWDIQDLVTDQTLGRISDTKLRQLLRDFAAAALEDYRRMKGIQGTSEGQRWGGGQWMNLEAYFAARARSCGLARLPTWCRL